MEYGRDIFFKNAYSIHIAYRPRMVLDIYIFSIYCRFFFLSFTYLNLSLYICSQA